MTCDGLVCIPEPGWINVLNPCMGELLRFPSGPNPVDTSRYDHYDRPVRGEFRLDFLDFFPGYWSMGFGKDEVSGSYKIVRMFFDTDQTEILDINIGEWRKLPSPPYPVEAFKHSAFVNGSIYWYQLIDGYKILALDLHTEQFRDVPRPLMCPLAAPLVNLDDRLALTTIYIADSYENAEIWIMDTKEETWTKIYSIRILPIYRYPRPTCWMYCIPLTISKQGNFYFYDIEKRLFKYYPKIDQVCCINKHVRVLSPFVENMIPLQGPKIMTYPPGFQYSESRISKIFRQIKLPTTLLLTTTVVALVIFRFSSASSRSLC
ncbi:PREDICTED: F-box/LRR-repeat protein At2g43260-like [Camelina sativa]|uniref:F-box/LRR-repeat protein At2g43260-like n=1 Tax=Camelina sativa TaxID=90675 RepID=A0ABM0Z4K7_CAMSA|nr:PREDICTED: F-box/LRR-repeat protein At2g43260-like [Camelina sativa]